MQTRSNPTLFPASTQSTECRLAIAFALPMPETHLWVDEGRHRAVVRRNEDIRAEGGGHHVPSSASFGFKYASAVSPPTDMPGGTPGITRMTTEAELFRVSFVTMTLNWYPGWGARVRGGNVRVTLSTVAIVPDSKAPLALMHLYRRGSGVILE